MEKTWDFMPQMGPMMGYAVTVVIEPSNLTARAIPMRIQSIASMSQAFPDPKSS